VIKVNMTDKDIQLKRLEEEKKELTDQLELYEFNGPSVKVQEVEDKLYEVNDTIKKLNV